MLWQHRLKRRLTGEVPGAAGEAPAVLGWTGEPAAVNVPGWVNAPGWLDAPGWVDAPGCADVPGWLNVPGCADVPGWLNVPGCADVPGEVDTPVGCAAALACRVPCKAVPSLDFDGVGIPCTQAAPSRGEAACSVRDDAIMLDLWRSSLCCRSLVPWPARGVPRKDSRGWRPQARVELPSCPGTGVAVGTALGDAVTAAGLKALLAVCAGLLLRALLGGLLGLPAGTVDCCTGEADTAAGLKALLAGGGLLLGLLWGFGDW